MGDFENVISSIKDVVEVANDVGEDVVAVLNDLGEDVLKALNDVEGYVMETLNDVVANLEDIWGDVETFITGILENVTDFLEGLEILLYVIPLIVGGVVALVLIKKIVGIIWTITDHRKLNAIYKNSKHLIKCENSRRFFEKRTPLIEKSWKSKFTNIKNSIFDKVNNFDNSKWWSKTWIVSITKTIDNVKVSKSSDSKKIFLKMLKKFKNSSSKLLFDSIKLKKHHYIQNKVETTSFSQTSPVVSSKPLVRNASFSKVPPVVPPRPLVRNASFSQTLPVVSSKPLSRNASFSKVPPVVPPRPLVRNASFSQTLPVVSSKPLSRNASFSKVPPVVPPRPLVRNASFSQTLPVVSSKPLSRNANVFPKNIINSQENYYKSSESHINHRNASFSKVPPAIAPKPKNWNPESASNINNLQVNDLDLRKIRQSLRKTNIGN